MKRTKSLSHYSIHYSQMQLYLCFSRYIGHVAPKNISYRYKKAMYRIKASKTNFELTFENEISDLCNYPTNIEKG